VFARRRTSVLLLLAALGPCAFCGILFVSLRDVRSRVAAAEAREKAVLELGEKILRVAEEIEVFLRSKGR